MKAEASRSILRARWLPSREVALGFLGSLLLRVLAGTIRWQRSGLEIEGVHWGYLRPLIVCFWHSDQLFAPWTYLNFRAPRDQPDRERIPARVLISEHSDGRLIAEALRFLSIGNIPGSSTRGGLRALVQMKRALERDRVHVVITPDGPKGPAREVKPGIVALASQTGTPIFPLSIAFERSWTLRSWDRMQVPKPFTRGCMLGGDLISVPPDLDKDGLERECARLSSVLHRLKEEAEASFAAKVAAN